VALGGRVAEEMIFGHDQVTSGASGDIKMATTIARAHGDRVGHERQARPAALRRQPGRGVPRPFDRASTQSVSDETQQMVDEEVKRFVTEGFETARQVLTRARISMLHTIAQGLLEYETLSGDEIRDLLAGKPPVREPTDPPPSEKKGSSVPVTKPRHSGGEEGTGGIEPEPQPQA
jgi:cell division protease FtsH